MDHDLISEDERKRSKQLLNQEACTLLSEIQRLEKQRLIQSDRLKNAMQLVRLEILLAIRLPDRM